MLVLNTDEPAFVPALEKYVTNVRFSFQTHDGCQYVSAFFKLV